MFYTLRITCVAINAEECTSPFQTISQPIISYTPPTNTANAQLQLYIYA